MIKPFSIKLIVVGFVAGLVVLAGIWQVYSSYQALMTDIKTRQSVNINEVKEVLKLWQERTEFSFGEVQPVASGEAAPVVTSGEGTMVKVQILNASGKPKAAATWKDTLEKITSIAVDSLGNTAVATVTLVQSKQGVAASVRVAVVAALKKGFTDVLESVLADDESVDMVVILGK